MIEFRSDDEGIYWVALSGRSKEEIIRSPSFEKKSLAAKHLGRVKGCFRDKEKILFWAKTIAAADGTPEEVLAGPIRRHAGIYALAAAIEILADVEPTPEVDEAFDVLRLIAKRHNYNED